MVRGRAIAPYTKANVLLACLQRPVWTSVELGAAVGLCASSVKAVLQELGVRRPRGGSRQRRRANEAPADDSPLLLIDDVAALLRLVATEDVSLVELQEIFLVTHDLLSHVLENVHFYLEAFGSLGQVACAGITHGSQPDHRMGGTESEQFDGEAVAHSSRFLTEMDREAIVVLRSTEGLTSVEIASLYGVSRQTVHEVLAQLAATCSTSFLLSTERLRLADAADASELQVQPNFVGRMDVKCDWCQALHFPGETSRFEEIDGVRMRTFQDCCAHGKLFYRPLPYPDELKPLLTRQDGDAEEFHRRIRSYNSSCSFASINASTYNFPTHGPYCYRVHGAVINKFNTAALPDQDDRPKYGQLFVIDGASALENRLQVPANHGLDERILVLIDDVLRRINPYAQAYHSMGQIVERYEDEAAEWCRLNGRPREEAVVPTIRLAFDLKRSYSRSYNVPVVSEVAAVFVTHGGGEMPDAHIVVHPKGKQVRTLSTLSADLEPMTFALLFPFATRGWSPKLPYIRQPGTRKYQSRREFVAYRLAVREGQFNPIHFGGRLFQEYVVCNYIYVEADRMQWYRENQKKIRADHYDGVNNRLQRLCQQGGFTLGRRVILPATHPGSPRSQDRHYQDSMAIVQRFGRPHLFITMTANPKWPEITAACTYYVSADPADPTVKFTAEPGFVKMVQSANDRPDLVARVFDLKKDALLKKIMDGQFFGRTVAQVHVIEYQKRGLPHMHLLVTLCAEDAPTISEDVDRMIRATIPDPVTEKLLHEAVKRHHIHGPCDVGDSVCLAEDGTCTKKFPKPFRRESAVGEDGYAEPARPDDGPVITYASGKIAHNGFVIPYNPQLLLEFDCHINVEICGGIRFVNYLYKYCYKQLDSAHLELTADRVLDCDEIKKYIDCRYVSPQEAAWRILEKPMQGKSHAVIVLHVHQRHEKITDLETGEPGISVDEDGKYVSDKSHLDAFFRLCTRDRTARQLYYYQVPEHYKWDTTTGEWLPRVRRSKTIGRLCNVDVRISERYYLRLLLLNVKGPRSYDELKVVGGRCYRTYAEACVARGLARNDEEWRECMAEASGWKFPRQLRQLFAMILAWNNPRDPRRLWDEYKETMAYDFIRYRNFTRERAIDAAFAEVVAELALHGKTLRDFPTLPQTVRAPDDEETVDADEEMRMASSLYDTLTDEQRRIVNHVLPRLGMQFGGVAADNTRVKPPEGDAIFVDGPGGSGKSYTYRCLFHALRAYGFNVVMMASTGAAAILLPTFTTVHQAVTLPVPLTSGCNANPRGKRLAKVLAANVFIWDEAPMMPRYALEAINRLLREVHRNQQPFGGVMMILGGDFRQCLPIEEFSLVSEQLNLSLKRCELWQHFTTFKLTRNLRLSAGQELYDTWTMAVGEGTNLSGPDGQERVLDSVIFRGSLVDEVYCQLLNGDPLLKGPQLTKYLAGRCILSVLNEVCNWYNDVIIERLPGIAQVSTSFDEIVPESAGDTRRHPTEMLNKIDLPGFPPHKLKLKKNAVVMMLRNIQPALGLVNGCRLLVMEAKRNVLLCRILNGSHAGQIREIPRITLTYTGRQYPFKFTRHQFPVRLAFALTVNKSQGQTLDFVGADLRHRVFSHGQLYVIITRVRKMQNIRLLLDVGERTTRNIVYKEIL